MTSDRRFRTPERGQPIKQRSVVHDEEPTTKKIILETDGDDYNDSVDVD